MQLTERCDIWRMVGRYDGGKEESAVYTRIPCLRVPLGTFDKVASAMSASLSDNPPGQVFRDESRTAMALFLVENWVGVIEDDELRMGRRTTIDGTITQYRYTVSGIHDYDDFGYQNTLALFCERAQ